MTSKTQVLNLETFKALSLSKPFDPEAAIALVEGLLSSHQELNSDVLREVFIEASKCLRLVAEATWWACSCSKSSPLAGYVDIFCEQCGDMRMLPERLSSHPWPLFVACLKYLDSDGWFERLNAAFEPADDVSVLAKHVQKSTLREYASTPEGVGSVLTQSANRPRGRLPPTYCFLMAWKS